MDDAAYPFLAFSGIPSVSFRFTSDRSVGHSDAVKIQLTKYTKHPSMNTEVCFDSVLFLPQNYPYFGTLLDTRDKLSAATGHQVSQMAVSASQFAGHMVLRLVHDHLLRFDLKKYNKIIQSHVARINTKVYAIKRVSILLINLILSLDSVLIFFCLIAAFIQSSIHLEKT